MIPEKLYRFVLDRVVGKLLVYSYKRELDAGNLHEARHVEAAVRAGNTGNCVDTCSLETDASKVSHLPMKSEFRDSAHANTALHNALVHQYGELRVGDDDHWQVLNQLRAQGFTVMKRVQ